MKTILCVIFDNKAKVYNRPFTQINNAVARRTAQDLVNDPNSDCCRNPQDFTMLQIGYYEDTTATITTLDEPETICRFQELPQDTDRIVPTES